jgi:hypothetical protein
MTNAELLDLLREARTTFRCPNTPRVCACIECTLRAHIDAALASPSAQPDGAWRQDFAHSNVILKERDDGRWCFAITPGELIFPMTTFATKEDALDHADQVAKKNGWPPVYRPGSDPTKVSTTISYDGNVDAVGLGSAAARGMR